MNHDHGFAKLYRLPAEHWVMKDPVGFRLWAYICMMAAYEPKTVSTKKGAVELEPGQMLFGLEHYAALFGDPVMTIRRRLTRLADDTLVNRQATPLGSVLTVLAGQSRHESDMEVNRQATPIKEAIKKNQEGTDKHSVAGAPKKVVAALDWSPLNLTPELMDEVRAIRKTNTKGKPFTQRIINTLAGEFANCRAAGATDDQILNEWSARGWQGFKAEWFLRDFKRPGQPSLVGGVQQYSKTTAGNLHLIEGNW